VPPLPPATTTPLLADGPQSTARRAESPRTTEAALMATLRPLVEAAPRRAVDMAREGQRRFGATNDAPERDWIIVKALVNLGELHAARDEARRMVETYPDSQWTQDVRRHLLVYPLDQPSREEMQRRDAAEP